MATIVERNTLIEAYFRLGMKYEEITFILGNTHGLSISVRQLKRVLKDLNLYRRRYSDLETVIPFIQEQLQGSGQLLGYRMMHAKCLDHEHLVRKEDVRFILKESDPAGVALRRTRRLMRRTYNVPDPNHIWHLDGYDKLKPYGLCISCCIDGFSRKIIWLNVYNTNNNPRVIGGYYLEAIKEHGGCPRVVRGDFGTETGHVRDFQVYFQRFVHGNMPLAPYIDGPSTANQRIEGWWCSLRKQCLHFWIELFKTLQDEGYYRGDNLDKHLMVFTFTALIQIELDQAAQSWNSHIIRPSANLNVPHGRPNVMYYAPALWGAEDRLCTVSSTDFDACCGEAVFRSAIPCDEDVYQLCVNIMGRDQFQPPNNYSDAVELYFHLRRSIQALL